MTALGARATAIQNGSEPATRARPALLTSAVTLFSSALLLFGLQPLVGRLVLPQLGGSPAVWNTCLVFFQGVLLAGYLYAHLLSQWLPPRRQLVTHAAVLLLPLLVLPIAQPTADASAAHHPASWLLGFLCTRVALPFFAISTTAPLVQRWFAESNDSAARDPYFLYAASNLGSFAALLAYPFLVEPAFDLSSQSRAWAAAYFVVGFAVLGAGRLSIGGPAPGKKRGPNSASVHIGQAPDLWDRGWWLLLAAVPSSLLLGVTTFITTDVAPVPLLWVVPLALYLLAFALAFAVGPERLQGAFPPLLVTLVVVLVAQSASGQAWPLVVSLPLHLSTFSIASIFCLFELASRRPASSHLTEYYAWVALGGVLGGAFNAFVAPIMFDSLLEYPLAMVAVCGLLPFSRALFPARFRREVAFSSVLSLLVAVALLCAPARASGFLVLASMLTLAIVISWATWRDPRWFGLGALAVLGASLGLQGSGTTIIAADRSFFGVYRVVGLPTPPAHALMHGTTLHGVQRLQPEDRGTPLTYFHRTGPIGEAISASQATKPALEVGIIGLGAGSLAAYARPTDRFTFFEIDSTVERVARNPAYFTFLRDCGDGCRVEIGDARITLSLPRPRTLDVLVLDAFTSDAIPVHLLTLDALRVYLSRLADDGLIAFHISNRHLRLLPVVAALAQATNLNALSRVDEVTARDHDSGKTASHWVLLARPGQPALRVLDRSRWTDVSKTAPGPLWTDNYSSLVGVLWAARPTS